MGTCGPQLNGRLSVLHVTTAGAAARLPSKGEAKPVAEQAPVGADVQGPASKAPRRQQADETEHLKPWMSTKMELDPSPTGASALDEADEEESEEADDQGGGSGRGRKPSQLLQGKRPIADVTAATSVSASASEDDLQQPSTSGQPPTPLDADGPAQPSQNGHGRLILTQPQLSPFSSASIDPAVTPTSGTAHVTMLGGGGGAPSARLPSDNSRHRYFANVEDLSIESSSVQLGGVDSDEDELEAL